MAWKDGETNQEELVLAGEVTATTGETVSSLFNRIYPILTRLSNENFNRFLKGKLVATGASGNLFISECKYINTSDGFMFGSEHIRTNTQYGSIMSSYRYLIRSSGSLYFTVDEWGVSSQNIADRSTDNTMSKAQFYW